MTAGVRCFSVLGMVLILLAGIINGTACAASESVVIRRTAYGIPHVLADDFAGLGFGLGYAFAEDNMCSLADIVLTVAGERSRYFGGDANAGDPVDRPLTNIDSDVFHRSLHENHTVERVFDQQPPLGPTTEVEDIIDGYANGVNRYLADVGVAGLPDSECRDKPWVRPITPLDVHRMIYDITVFGGLGRVKTRIATAAPTPHQAAPIDAVFTELADDTVPLGSNGIAVGRDATPQGGGFLLANPHFPWRGALRFYQAQLTIPGVLDVAGATLPGVPLVMIGHTARVAWTHTVSTARRHSLYALPLVPGDPTNYLVDGRPERMTERSIAVPVLGGGTVHRTVYSSRYGPVLGGAWTESYAVSLRDVNADNGRTANVWLAMNRAGSVAELRAAQDRYQAVPFVNTLAVDDTGVAYYADASVVPHLTDEQALLCGRGPGFPPSAALLDGSLSLCEWGSDADAVTPGIFGPRAYPALTRTDFVTNSNDSAWLTNPAAPIVGTPQIFGPTATMRSLRTRVGLDIIDRRLRGTDGFGPPGFTIPTALAAFSAERNHSAELARDSVVSMCRKQPTAVATDGRPVELGAACAALAQWDLRARPDSGGAVLWREFWLAAERVPNAWTVPFDPVNPLTTPNTLNTASPDIRRALADAVARLADAGVAPTASLSSAQRSIGTGVAVPGCTHQEGCYNVIAGDPPGLRPDGTFAPVDSGSSFMMAIELSPAGPSARTLLTYSQSAAATSPHHSDQTQLFTTESWIADRFSESEIRADPALRTRVLHP
ncbi:penicillin acylase family protein [Nocardia sp. NPDC049149]|uniref:penicillin acylase family protein n=1 Tax=Nocardia sp. NPDC049149 TaxID=3364315 RepID=UPI00371A837E